MDTRKEPCIGWGLDPPREEALLGDLCRPVVTYPGTSALRNVHCSPASVGKCACPAHAADEYIRRGERFKKAMRPFVKLFWTLDFLS